jgi:hypothetical protein
MATEQQANEARRRYGRELMRRGAHAIGVEEGTSFGKKGFVVVAHVPPKKKADVPESLTGDDFDVPVVVVRSEPFTAE